MDRPRVLIRQDELGARVAELGRSLARDYAGARPVLIGVLTGALVFLSDLMRAMPIDLSVDVVGLASYGPGTRPGAVRRLIGLSAPIEGRAVVVVEDIVDTGRTLALLLQDLEARGATSVRLCVLLDKIARREVDVPVDYRGFVIPDVFVVGYGLDHAGVHRNLPYVGVMEPAEGAPERAVPGRVVL